ncbi:16S rRNA (cytosine(1402)-N(4))-methyltransferase RsmH [Saccharospirillum impatiens]|uniref:16S rRNA (cytosine(1402)-N(4))-methyltransferase RsmH n=1 Tax=Saccharospirillum impatiens TaxID=169438 RepID=UPI000401117A|nr:16S rRNA (cytosine(1402)-N(4))-methyltransferase RsmH [Saccharospirillum impatiens]
MTPKPEQAFSHDTVLLHETVAALQVADGVYVDGTYGRGGHSRLLLEQLAPGGQLVVVDKDPLAIASADALAGQDARVSVCHASFADLKAQLQQRDLAGRVNGILLDLGVSSPQLDDASRGFSFRSDGPLDMRMDPTSGVSAAQWLTHVGETDLANVLFRYGDERYSRRIARAIVRARSEAPITTTLQLADIVSKAHPAWERHKHPATRSFQAIRIHINAELSDLEVLLADCVALLAPGGRLAVITFHSLEDRLVKQFIREQEKGPELPPGLPVLESDIPRTMKKIGKPIKASPAEVQGNIRSRSATLRVAEKL